jgi:hypothetical protein
VSSASPGRPRRAPELRLPYPFLEYLLELPGDYAKLTLRLLQRAQWVPSMAPDGVSVDAGETLLSLRSRDVWSAVRLDRDVDEAGRVSLLRRVLQRLDRDGFVAIRPAHGANTGARTGRGARRDTPATIVRFLKYRDSLWPANVDATHGTTLASTHGAAQPCDTIPSDNPALPAPPGESPREAVAEGGGPRIADVRAVLAMAASAFEEVTGARYQHAQAQAIRADRRAAAELLATATPTDVEMVWRWALRQPQWPRIETLADLSQHWARVSARALAVRASGEPARTVEPNDGTCGLWDALASDLRRRLRPDLFDRWFAPLKAYVEDGELVVVAPDRFHRSFLEDNYQVLLDEQLGAANVAAAPSARAVRARITDRALRGAAAAAAPCSR